MISGVISRESIVLTQISLLMTPLITTHEPPSRGGHGSVVGGTVRVSTRALGPARHGFNASELNE